MLALVLAMQLAIDPQIMQTEVGDILVQAPAGYEVKLDGESHGAIPKGQKSMVIRDVPVGRHIVDVMKPASAGNSRYDVEVLAGGTATVAVSNLAGIVRPRAVPKTGDLHVKIPQAPCRANVGGANHELDARESIVRNVPMGKQTLRLQCGTQQLEGSIEVKDGMVSVIDADLTKKKMTVAGVRARSLNVSVSSAQHHAIPADLPADWRRALSATLDSSMNEVQISRKGWTSVEITFTVAHYDDVWRFQQRISERYEVAQVTWLEFVRTGRDGGRAKFKVDFAGGTGEG